MEDNSIGRKVVEVLRDNSHSEEADRLASWLTLSVSDDEAVSRDACWKIVGVCTVRSYGDLSVSTMNGWAWNTMLEKLKKRVSKKLK